MKRLLLSALASLMFTAGARAAGPGQKPTVWISPPEKHGLADESTWYVAIMQQGYDYASVGGRPDQVVIESWIGAPSRCTPETDEWTFTRSVRDFAPKFARQPAR
ncbi:MAG: hypothetical protein ABI318_11990 [Chthoniobacteraceae bacterium]